MLPRPQARHGGAIPSSRSTIKSFKALSRLPIPAEAIAGARAEGYPSGSDPHLLIINQGDSARELRADTLKQAAYAGGAVAVTTNDAAKRVNAINALYAWLQEPKSHLRGAMAMLSAGGIFFVAQAHERSIRAYMAHGGGTKEKFLEAMQTRGSADASILQPAPASYDMWS